MTDCRIHEERLDDLLDGELSPAQTLEVESHLAGCPACRRALDERRALAGAIERLPESIAPPHDRWPAVRAAIAGAPRRRDHRTWLAAASIVLGIGLAGLVGYRVGVGRSTPSPVPLTVAEAVGDAEREYAEAASAFLAVVEQRLPTLSPESRAVILESLDELDHAIAQLRAALDEDPADVEANRSWNALYRRKIRFLRSVSRLSS